MRFYVTFGWIVMLSAIWLVGCSTSYKMATGNYQLTLKNAPTVMQPDQRVEVKNDRGRLTVKNPRHELVLTGQISGNQIVLTGQDDGNRLELKGELTADNQGQGEVVQKSGDEIVERAGFVIRPLP